VATAAQPETADGVSQSTAGGRTTAENPFVSKAAKHHWYGDTSPRSEQQLEDHYSFKRPQAQATTKVVIMDRENPPQPRSARTVESKD
jgi:hypothetical protein